METTTQDPVQISLLNTEMSARDKSNLQEAAHRLLAHGSILRERSVERNLYDWCIEHQGWIEEWSQLLGMKLIIQRDERVIMVIPEVGALTRKLKRDETLVGLALWFDYDVEVRENAAHDVFFTVRMFNEQFRSKFPSLQPLSASRLKEIFRTFSKLNIIEMEWADEFPDSVIQILPTLRFIIPFPEIEEWHRIKDRFNGEESETSSPDGRNDTPLPPEAEVVEETVDQTNEVENFEPSEENETED